MSAVGVGTKYHCGLNGQGFLLTPNGYAKKDASVFAPRFGTGEQGLSDLDLFRSIAQQDMSAGSFQQILDNADPKFAMVKSMIFNQADKLLYTVPSAAVAAFTGNSKNDGYRGVLYKGVLYFIANIAANGKVFKYNPSTKTQTSVKADFTQAVTDLAVFGNKLWAAAGTAGTWTYDGTTWVNVAGFQPQRLLPFRTRMLCNGAGVGAGKLYSCDNAVGTQATIGEVGDTNRPINSFCLFNSRAYIGKPDGLFVYDGVQVSNILDTLSDPDADNFMFMAQLNGILYFTFKNSVWSFNGASVAIVQNFGSTETIKHMTTVGGRLWVTTAAISASGDIFAIGAANYYCFDGLGWSLYYSQPSGQDYAGVMYCNDGTYRHFIFATFKLASAYDASYDVIDHNNEFKAAASAVGNIYTPTIDAGFPNIDKYLDSVSPDFDRMIAGDSVEAQFKLATSAGDTASQNVVMPPATAADDATVGTVAWGNPSQANAQDGGYSDNGALGQASILDDSYAYANADASIFIYSSQPGVGNAFQAQGSGVLDYVKFYLWKTGTPTGLMRAKIYTHTGTYGTNSKPGTLLATSDTLDVSIVDGIERPYQFSFSGAQRINLTNGTYYFITIEFSGGSGSNHINVMHDTSSPTHTGHAGYIAGGVWVIYNTAALIFFVYRQGLSVVDNLIKLVKGGVIGGNSKADGVTAWPRTYYHRGPGYYIYSPADTTYGGVGDLWGNALTPADINAATFGVAISSKTTSTTGHYLKLTNFGFAIPAGATVNGVVVTVRKIDLGIDSVTIRVYYTIAGDTWISLGTLTSTSTSRKLLLFLTQAYGVWRRIQLKFIITRGAASNLGFRQYNMAYYLSPDQTWQWQLRLICTGTDETKLRLLDDNLEACNGANLREKLYQARWTDSPIAFEDIDFTTANGAVLATGDITVKSTDGFRNAGFVKIDDEIIRYTSKTATTFVGCTRGSLTTSASTHADASVVNAYYRVVIKSIDAENLAGDPTVPNQLTSGQESYVSLTIQEAPSG